MEQSSVSYKCPNCGAEVIFDAEKQKFVCEWCMSDFTDEQIKASSKASEHEEELDSSFAADTDVYVCSSCGAEIICDHNTAASFCYYCHSPVSLSGRLNGRYRPEMILPFKFSREQAVAAFRAMCSKKWFLPSDFLSTSQLEKITGLYVPFWLADCSVDAYLIGEGHDVNTRHFSRYTEVTTSIFNFDRAAKMKYMGVPADGSKKIEDSLMDAIEPFDYKALKPFDMSFLSGFYCDKYDVDKTEVASRIRKRVEESTEQILRDDVKRYDTVNVKHKGINNISTKWHYMMLPVWFMTYKHNGKIYSFAMNGQTGKFAGIFPVSGVKAAIASVITAIAVGAVTIIIDQL